MFERRRQAELMDDPDVDPAEHRLALRGLQRINRFSRSVRILADPILRLARLQGKNSAPLRVLDIATGSGDIPIEIALAAQHAGFGIQVHGVDKSETAVGIAQANAARLNSGATFSVADVFQDELPADFDVATCSLFMHHLDPDDAVTLIRKMAQSARKVVLINDLERSRAGFALAYVGTRLLSASRIVHVDGPRSVMGAYTREEARELAERAGLADCRISRRWPCRFLLEWTRK